MSAKRNRDLKPGQHFSGGPGPSEDLVGKAGTSAVRHEDAQPGARRPGRPPTRLMRAPNSSARLDFAELKWKLKPDVQFCRAGDSKESYGSVRAESWKLDQRGMILKLWLPNLEWLKYLLTNQVLLKIDIPMPSLGAKVSVLGRVAWANSADDPVGGFAVGVVFDRLNVIDRDRLLRFSTSIRSTARGLP